MENETTLKSILGGHKYLTICSDYGYIPIDIDECNVEYYLSVSDDAKDYLVDSLPESIDLDTVVIKSDEITIEEDNDCIVVVLKEEN